MNRVVKSAGFTLIELIVALSIFSLVLVVVTAGLRTVLDFRDQLNKRQERIRQLQFAMLILERDVQQMIQYGEKTSSLIYQPLKAVEFVRTGVVNPKAYHARSTLQRVYYSMRGGQLIRTSVSNWLENTGVSHSVPILSGVKAFSVQFWTHDHVWVNHWPAMEQPLTDQEPGRTPQTYDHLKNRARPLFPKAVVFTIHMKDLGEISRVFAIPLGVYHVAL